MVLDKLQRELPSGVQLTALYNELYNLMFLVFCIQKEKKTCVKFPAACERFSKQSKRRLTTTTVQSSTREFSNAKQLKAEESDHR